MQLNFFLQDSHKMCLQLSHESSVASYTDDLREVWKQFATQKHSRNECVEVYSRCCSHFMGQVSSVSHFKPFHARSGKIMKLKGFSRKKIYVKENSTSCETWVGNSRAA